MVVCMLEWYTHAITETEHITVVDLPVHKQFPNNFIIADLLYKAGTAKVFCAAIHQI